MMDKLVSKVIEDSSFEEIYKNSKLLSIEKKENKKSLDIVEVLTYKGVLYYYSVERQKKTNKIINSSYGLI